MNVLRRLRLSTNLRGRSSNLFKSKSTLIKLPTSTLLSHELNDTNFSDEDYERIKNRILTVCMLAILCYYYY